MIIARSFNFSFSLALLLAAPVPAHAFYQSIADLFVKDLSFFGGHPPSAVPFTSQAYCEAVVENLTPNNAIIDGLMAIEKLQRSEAEESILTCLPQIKSSWENELAKWEPNAKFFKKGNFQTKKTSGYVDAVDQAPNQLAQAFQYSWNRILYLHQSFLRSGGKFSDAKKFCVAYQANLERDRLYAESYQLQAGKNYGNGPGSDFFSLYGVTEAELSGIQLYTGSAYGSINKDLRGKNPSESTKIFTAVTDSGLKKTKGFKGAVVRFDCLPTNVAAEHTWGNIVTYPAFTSTSSRMDFSWSANCENGGIRRRSLICTDGVGADVEPITSTPGEDEVLFPSNSKFQVVEKHPVKGADDQELHVMVAVDDTGKPSTSPEVCAKEIKVFLERGATPLGSGEWDLPTKIKMKEQDKKSYESYLSKLENDLKEMEANPQDEAKAKNEKMKAELQQILNEHGKISMKSGKSPDEMKKLKELEDKYYALSPQINHSYKSPSDIKATIKEYKGIIKNTDLKLEALKAELEAKKSAGKEDGYESKLKKFEEEKAAYLKKKGG